MNKRLLSGEERKRIFANDKWCLPYDNILSGYLEAQDVKTMEGVFEEGDSLLNNAYWRGKFSTGEIKQFWEQLKGILMKP